MREPAPVYSRRSIPKGLRTLEPRPTRWPDLSATSILDAFARRVRQSGEDVVLSSGTSRVTAREIAALAREIEGAFGALPGPMEPSPAPPLVALQTPNGPFFLAAILASRALGRGLVLLDRSAPPRERDAACAALGVGALLHSRDGWDGPWSWAPLADPRPAPEGTDFVKMTSGSTGEPRGVLLTERALIADDAQLASTMGLEPADRLLAVVPFSHSYGLASLVMPALMRRSSLVVPDPGDPLGPARAMSSAACDVVPTVPALLQGVVQRQPRLSPSVRLVISAGAPLAPAVARAFLEKFDLPVHSFYGTSETGGITYDRTGSSALEGSLGAPVDDVEVTLEGDEDAGRVVVRTPALATGYAPTAEPELDGQRFLTSDLGTFDGRELRLLGRVDEIINVRGKKVHPATVESVLRGAPGVIDVVVVEHGASSDPGLRAYVERDGSGSGTDQRTLFDWCREHLAEHKVPRSFVVLDTFPRTERGKLDRQALLQHEPGD